MAMIKVEFKQENYDGVLCKYVKEFETREDAQKWMDEQEKSANYINKPFSAKII